MIRGQDPVRLPSPRGVTKWILRECVRDLPPPSILARRPNEGFGVSLAPWFEPSSPARPRSPLRSHGRRCPRQFDARGACARWWNRRIRDDRRVRQVWALAVASSYGQSYLDAAPRR